MHVDSIDFLEAKKYKNGALKAYHLQSYYQNVSWNVFFSFFAFLNLKSVNS